MDRLLCASAVNGRLKTFYGYTGNAYGIEGVRDRNVIRFWKDKKTGEVVQVQPGYIKKRQTRKRVFCA